MSDALTRICEARRADVAERKQSVPPATLESRARNLPPPRPFAEALRRKASEGQPGLIAEIKKASPSHGLIRPDFDPATLARAYEAGGAACLSVLTESRHFSGADDHLASARAAVPLPALRKDFMLEPYQIIESRAIGADCVLLIMAALSDCMAVELAECAREWGMDVLVEVHDAEELERARAVPGTLLGVNNRNLKTLKTDLATTEALAPLAPADRLIVAESGLAAPADVARMAAAGAAGILVGEGLLRHADVTAATRRLLSPIEAAA